MKLEEKISHAVDKIVIILESQSAFVELGAFSIDLFRDKLIVVNNLEFINAPSFINSGPLKQVFEDNPKNLIHYKFHASSKDDPCPVADIFPALNRALDDDKFAKIDPIYIVRTWPNQKNLVSPASLMFLHDIIHLIGPVTHYDIIDAYKNIYPMHSKFDAIKEMRALLSAMTLIQENKNASGVFEYTSSRKSTFFRFESGITKFIARVKISQRKFRTL